MQLLHFFMKKTARAKLKARPSMSSSSCSSQHRNLKSYCEVVNYLLVTYATDNIIANAYMDVTNFKQPPGQSAAKYAQALRRRPYTASPLMTNIASKKHSLND